MSLYVSKFKFFSRQNLMLKAITFWLFFMPFVAMSQVAMPLFTGPLISSNSSNNAQHKTDPGDFTLQGTWVIQTGSFPDSVVDLRRLVLPLDSTKMINAYRIGADGILTLFTYAPPRQKLCANGLPYINEGSATLQHHRQHLRVKLRGGLLMAGTFNYDILYQVNYCNDRLLLTRKQFFKKERCITCPQSRR